MNINQILWQLINFLNVLGTSHNYDLYHVRVNSSIHPQNYYEMGHERGEKVERSCQEYE